MESSALVLKTDRMELVPMIRQHAEGMFPILNDPTLYVFTGGSPPANVEILAQKYESWESRKSPDGSEHWLNWALRLRAEDKLIGHVQAAVSSEEATIAWIVGSSWQHQGYATEAARAVLHWLSRFGVRKIRASIHPAHTASCRVAERLGFEQTTDTSGEERIWKRVIV
jgi:RimJ/RimL family protein N-acetyltransferase